MAFLNPTCHWLLIRCITDPGIGWGWGPDHRVPDCLWPPKMREYIFPSVIHRYKPAPHAQVPKESFQKAEATSATFPALSHRGAGVCDWDLWVASILLRMDTTSGLLSLTAFSAEENPSILVYAYTCVSYFCSQMLVKGPGNKDAFQDKSKHTLKPARLCCLWFIHTVCIRVPLTSFALFSLYYGELSFTLMNLLCSKPDKRDWKAVLGCAH